MKKKKEDQSTKLSLVLLQPHLVSFFLSFLSCCSAFSALLALPFPYISIPVFLSVAKRKKDERHTLTPYRLHEDQSQAHLEESKDENNA